MDFSRFSDSDFERVMAALERNPDAIPDPAQRAAFTAAYFNRRKPASAAPNVDANLNAAASPLNAEPVAGPAARRLASMTDAEMLAPVSGEGVNPDDVYRPTAKGLDAYGKRYRKALSNFRDEAARGDGMRQQAAYNAATGVPAGEMDGLGAGMLTVDGVEVPEFIDSAGNAMPGRYRLGDLARAKEAKTEENRKADVAWMNERSPEFWQAQKDAQQTPRAQELRSQRLHARAGIPEPTDGLEGEAKLRAMIRNRETAQAEARRARLQAQGLLTGGNRNRQDNAMVNALLMLSPEDREQSLQYMLPGGDRAAAVDSRQLDQAARWAGQAVMGAVANGVGRQAQEGIVQQERIRDLRSKAVDARDNTWGDPYDAAKKALEAEGASPPEVQQILGELFPAGPVAAGGAGVPTPQRAVPTAPHPMNGLPAFGR